MPCAEDKVFLEIKIPDGVKTLALPGQTLPNLPGVQGTLSVPGTGTRAMVSLGVGDSQDQRDAYVNSAIALTTLLLSLQPSIASPSLPDQIQATCLHLQSLSLPTPTLPIISQSLLKCWLLPLSNQWDQLPLLTS